MIDNNLVIGEALGISIDDNSTITFFPGVYMLSKPLVFRRIDNAWPSGMHITPESRLSPEQAEQMRQLRDQPKE